MTIKSQSSREKRYRTSFLAFSLAALLSLTACWLPAPTTTPEPPATFAAGTATAASTQAVTRSPTAKPGQTSTVPSARTPTFAAAGCGANPTTIELVGKIQPDTWMEWIRQLSGAEPVTIGGEPVTIQTRFTMAMFDRNYQPKPNARGFEYLRQTVGAWYPAEQIQEQRYQENQGGGRVVYGKNLILTLPGTTKADEVVLLTAHFDAMSREPEISAPGAEDNGSGSAALLEAARLFRDYQFERTIRIIWFTGEELGLLGSKAYAASELFDPKAVVGVVNLDMFGYDSDGDRCFELHVGTLPASDRVGRCFLESAQVYDLGLETVDYLTADATSASDHGPFWDEGVGAIEVLENHFDNHLPNGCANVDQNPSYHTKDDTAARINVDSGIRIVRAALASVAALAGPR